MDLCIASTLHVSHKHPNDLRSLRPSAVGKIRREPKIIPNEIPGIEDVTAFVRQLISLVAVR